jgi:very-short-patch-repair endonuclease
VNASGVIVELQHAPTLCYAMQQNAVPWLRRLALRNEGPVARRDLHVTVELAGFAAPLALRLDELAPGAAHSFVLPDMSLLAEAFANTIERTRASLVVTVDGGGERLAVHGSAIDVLAYNEWPGLQPLPALLAAFVSPNHPALAPLLQEVAAGLAACTGSGALDGYQSGDARRARAIVEAVHDAILARGITYVVAPSSFERSGQKVRTPEQVLGERLGTCLDLALLHAAVLEQAGLRPFVVVVPGHAFHGAWLVDGSAPEVEIGPAVELRKRAQLDALVVVESTLVCAGTARPFRAAAAAGIARLANDADFVAAIDVAAARRLGIRPLPVRTSAFVAGEPLATVPPPIAVPPSPPSRVQPPVDAESAPAPPGSPLPKDRLELWQQKLLDLSLFNRLLNFAPTKKSVPLCAHDLGALEDKLQQGGRVRVHARPAVAGGGDPRDLQLAAQRAGGDVFAQYLADELRAGRLRAELDAEELDDRLVEIFRHARTSLEETGANTLYLAIGFLKWFETPQSTKARRAPLLLLPLVVERLSVQDGCRFVLDDAEPRLNRTLLQFLQRDFELRVPLGETPPEGELGVDVAAVLEAFRRAVLGQSRWEVETTACIGFFSFTKYLMWLDLQDREALLQSPVLEHLVERPGTAFAQDAPEFARERLDAIDPATVLCPKDADSSQLAAVLAAAGGRSFVLEGPPGTGKSQTITNLIAQSLADGKRVLFVAEKRAALEVVQRRLAEVGLGPFCLELHSSKSGPKAALAQLQKALAVGQRREPAEWAKVAADLHAARTSLNRLVHELHRPREHGVSVFAAMAELVGLRTAARVDVASVLAGGPERVAAAGAAVAAVAAAAAPVGVPSRSPWWGVRRSDWRPAIQDQVVPSAAALAHAAVAVTEALPPVVQALALESLFGARGPSRDQLTALRDLAVLLGRRPLPPAALLRVADWPALAQELQRAVDAGTARDAEWGPLTARWRRELLDADLDRLAGAYARHAESFVLVRWWRLRGPRAELAPLAAGPPGRPTAVRDDLVAALRVRAQERTLAACTAAASALGAAWNAGAADWAQVAAFRQWVVDVRAAAQRLRAGATAPDPACLAAIARLLESLAAGDGSLPPKLDALRGAEAALTSALAATRSLLDLDDAAAFGGTAEPGFLRHAQARVQQWQAAGSSLRDWCAFVAAAVPARGLGATALLDAHARGDIATGALVPTFRASWLRAWLDAVHEREPALATFRGLDHERAIAAFRDVDERAIRLAGEVVLARLAAALPQLRDTTVASSELGILEREIKKQRKHRPLRRLFAEVPGLLGKLAPCMLMSPLTVAQLLAQPGQHFDLVVFDEASQIPMWDAVGAIGRGQSLVVVGDSRQLPPTTFFQRQAQGDEIGADELPDDLESVLDECSAAGLPRLHLDWHYRSRHESLIAFSNALYYQNRLLTFPAPQARPAPGLGVRSVRVPGVYDRAGSQQNRIEAEALVAEVKARLLDPARSRQSLGVVTFSQAQQMLVEDLLDEARRADPAIEAAFGAAATTEPVFVKNLENVQGDERDVILFSICYGPDAERRVFENYGPLNLQGGERRLNVAVTRARRELVVFTSLGPEQVATRTQALGARHLRAFLDYAQRGTAALAAATNIDPGAGPESPFETAVRDALVQRGHEVHTQVGCSGYRIDLAVVDPRAPGRYLLGIECDGATYHGSATARDRDRLRAAVLRGLGWRLHRIWSTDFWLDADGELERVEQALVAARAAFSAIASEPPPPAAAPPAPAVPAAAAVGEPSSAPPLDPDGPRPFRTCELPVAGVADAFWAATSLRTVRSQVATVIAAEMPVVFDRLCRLVAAPWGLRLTDRVRERVRAALAPNVVVVDDVVWSDRGDIEDFRGFRVPDDGADRSRDAEELPRPELVAAMAWLLRQHQALAADDLARETAKCFGITRLGSVVKATMARALEALLAAGHGRRDGDVIRLP